MIIGRVVAAAVAATLVIVLAVLASGDDDRYRLNLTLDNAAGLREGTGVKVAGLEAGEIEKLTIDDEDRVRAEVVIDEDTAPVGRDVRLSISPVNLLGQKVLELDAGDVADPAPSGFQVPARRVTTSADLDQVLAVLDPGTRTRLAVLLNEAGLAVSGRRLDIGTILRKYPRTGTQLNDLLTRLKRDNRSLGRLVTDGSEFISSLAAQRRQLGEVVESAGDMSAALGGRRAQLRQALSRAPRDLARLRAFLGDLEATTRPLGPAARTLTRISDPLRVTLKELKPFAETSRPVLAQAKAAAPHLSRLAAGATPIVRELQPFAADLQEFSTAMAPASRVLDKSSSNIIAIMDNWSHAIGLRDQLSHIFRAEAVVDPAAIPSLVERLIGPRAGKRRKPEPSRAREPRKPAGPAPASVPDADSRPAKPPIELPLMPTLTKPLNDAADAIGERLKPKGQPSPAGPSNDLLDFLLGP